jgi:3-dehydrotetronate 4-kinase
VLAGSCADRTLEQLSAFEQSRPVIRISPLQAAQGDLAPGLVARVLPMLAEGPVAIATSAPPGEVQEVQARLGVAGAAEVAEGLLGRVAAGLRREGVGRFLVAGGETSGAILDHLGVEEMQVGRYEAAGIGRAISVDNRPVSLCLKSGKLGPVNMFLPVLESMRGVTATRS